MNNKIISIIILVIILILFLFLAYGCTPFNKSFLIQASLSTILK